MAATAKSLEAVTDAALQARLDLAAVHRLAHRFGFDDGIWNHFTLMVPGTSDRFLVKAHGLLMNEITASNLIVADTEGNVVEGSGEIEASAFCIHSQIHMQHPNARCVLHAHPSYATWLADVAGGRVEMINQDSLRFYGRVAYDDDYMGAADNVDEGARMAAALGDKTVLIHRNHGVTTAGANVAEAFYDLYYLEVACKRQHLLAASGCTPSVVSDNVAAHTQGCLDAEFSRGARLHFDALKRELDREEPDYAS